MPDTPAFGTPTARILIVDDEPGASDIIARILSKAGHPVDCVATVAAALDAVREGGYALVVLDLVLDVDATPLHTALVDARLPVLLVSAIDPARLPGVASAHGWSFLARPFDAPSLTAAVSRALDRARGSQPPERVPGDRPTLAVVPQTREPAESTPPDAPGVSRTLTILDTDPEVARANFTSRRRHRSFVAVLLFVVVVIGQITGHAAPWYAIAVIGGLGFGSTGIIDALRKKPLAAGGAIGALALLAVVGSALEAPQLGAAAALGVGALNVLAEHIPGGAS